MSITLHDVVSEGHLPLTADWAAELEAMGQAAGPFTIDGDRGAAHQRNIDWTVTHDDACTGAQLRSRRVGVRLSGPNGTVLTGTTVLPPNLPSGYLHTGILLRSSADGAVDATVRFDVRLLCAEEAAGHDSRSPDAWGEDERRAFAVQFGSALATRFSDLFPDTLARLRPAP